MRALGNGHVVASTLARPVGPILQHVRLGGGETSIEKSTYPSGRRLSKTELYIPTREADMMEFGILVVSNVPDSKVGMTAEFTQL